MTIVWQENTLFQKREGKELLLSPNLDLNEEEAQELFELCRQYQSLFRSQVSPKSAGFLDLELLKMPQVPSVVLFPGSFSPWHKGHEACLLNLPQGKSVIVLPDFNPWKEVREVGLWAEVQEIWQGLQKVQSKRRDLNIYLYLGFLAGESSNPTIQWLPQVYAEERWLLMGEDTFLSLHKWKNANEVLGALSGLYVCPRAVDTDRVLKQRERLLQDVREDEREHEREHERKANGPSPLAIEFLAPHPYQNYSSTWARQKKKSSKLSET